MSLDSFDEGRVALIGDIPFGLDLQIIREILVKQRDELTKVNKLLNQEGLQKGLLDFACDKKTELETLLAYTPEQIMEQLKALYDAVLSAEQDGLNWEDVLSKLKIERPDLIQAANQFYSISRTQIWGYRIFQYIFAQSLRD